MTGDPIDNILIEKYGQETFDRVYALLLQYKEERRNELDDALILVPLADAVFNGDTNKAAEFYDLLGYRIFY